MSHSVEHDVDTSAPESEPATGPAGSRGPWRTRVLGSYRRMSPRARRIAIATVVGIIALVAVVWAVASRDRPATPTPAGMAHMEGMPGMTMTGGGSVRLTSAQIRQFGITFGTVELRPLTSEVRTTGVVTFNETRAAQVAPKFGGFVERLYVNFTGQPVQRGQPLMEVYSPDLVAAQQELLLAGQLQRDIGRTAVPGVPASTNLVEAARRRLRLWDVSEDQIDEILRTGRVSRTLTLYAPASGVVTEKRAVQGQSFIPGEHLYTIVDLSDVWVDVQVREMDAAEVRVGSGADVEFAGLPGRTFKGFVTYVYPMLDSASRAVRARVSITNTADNALKPGMYATVRLRTPARTALTVPSSAVLRTGERNIVFVDMGGGELMPHHVEVGRTAGQYTEVLAGVEPGQRVVTSAQFLLDSESNLAEVMRSMMGQMGAGDMKGMGGMRDMPGMDMPGMEMKQKGADMKNMPGMAPPPSAAPRPSASPPRR